MTESTATSVSANGCECLCHSHQQDPTKNKSISLHALVCNPHTEQGATDGDSPQALAAHGFKPKDFTLTMHLALTIQSQAMLLTNSVSQPASCWTMYQHHPAHSCVEALTALLFVTDFLVSFLASHFLQFNLLNSSAWAQGQS